MHYFTESDVRDLLPMPEAIRLVRMAFARLASGEALNQPRRRLAQTEAQTLTHDWRGQRYTLLTSSEVAVLRGGSRQVDGYVVVRDPFIAPLRARRVAIPGATQP